MPADAKPLLDFIDAMKSNGASDEFLVALLRQNGWSEKRIYQAFGAWYEAHTGATVPSGGGRVENAKDAFLYLLAFITLGIWTIQLGSLLFTAIDHRFPNPALDYTTTAWTVRQVADELASVLVAFPLFLFVTRAILRGLQYQPERLESSVRKWLTYLALVITASCMIADLVAFFAYFLRGDLSTRFVLKVMTVLVMAGGVFAYYLDSLHRDRSSPSRNRWFAVAAGAAVAFGIIVGFGHIGPPSAQRVASQDARRLSDLATIAQGLHSSWLSHRQSDTPLPATIEELEKSGIAPGANLRDPLTGRTYEYSVVRATNYRLCAIFARRSPSDVPILWRHTSGHACFALDASQDVPQVASP
jgi:hypothetical protein